ncbi:MAG: YwqG family protein [Pseudomonadota bacterium]
MARILDFFRRRRSSEQPAGRSFEEILQDVQPYSVPALMLRKSDGSSKSYLGGDPCLPADIEWPSKDGRELTFLASVDLGEAAVSAAISWLPATGKLLFFYDAEKQPWGFDPADRGGWSVVHVNETGTAESAQRPGLPQFFVEFEEVESLPDWQRFDALGIELDEQEAETYIDGYFEWRGDRANHQMGGYPSPVQGDDMELECQLASNGLNCGDGTAYQSDEGKRLAAGAKDWRLLLQFASDDDLGVMWGDIGDLYFWVKKKDSIKADFSNVWVVLQCS